MRLHVQRVHASQDEAARKSVARAKAADAPAMPPLRGFKGHTFTTPAGRKLGAEEYLANLERMSKPPGFDLLEWNDDGTVRMPLADTGAAARILPAGDIRAMSERLCPPPAERPKRPPPRRPVWITRQLVDNKWQDVEQPWKRRGASAQREAMCAMFDRCGATWCSLAVRIAYVCATCFRVFVTTTNVACSCICTGGVLQLSNGRACLQTQERHRGQA